MSERPHLTQTKRIAQAAREERLAQALRDNLRRRKEQTRAREPLVVDPTGDGAAGEKAPA
ncbi:MAG TPA: hypothetical protein VHW90_09390 [Stellaceae bacterium]|nr:hypothetical protein [Stellaceae bacterium]